MSNIINIKSISEVHAAMGMEKPKHPLITVLRHSCDLNDSMPADSRILSDLYFIALKDGIKGSFKYGRSNYDFEEGTLTFMKPGQVISTVEAEYTSDSEGWYLCFHPDLIRRSELGRNIHSYSFFEYDVNEALHVSDEEKNDLAELVDKIRKEIDKNIDKHSQKLIVTNIELLLDYCSRYYDRQFYVRSNYNKDMISGFDNLLKEYFNSNMQLESGVPTVKYCAGKLNLSPNYFSDLLKKETGRNAQEHIQLYVVDRAKTMLLNSEDSISQVAYQLGFEYSQHFSKAFKAKTGISPKEYRSSIN